jgi:predicted dehydrogenase
VVAGYKGGSPDVEASATRIERFTSELRDRWKIEIVPDIATLCSKVDAVLLESVDGRVHLEQVKPVFAARKPVFIDKPLAASYKDACAIADLAEKAGVPWFSSSSLRFGPVRSLRNNPEVGDVLGCDVYGPAPTDKTHPDLFWYGIHGIEMLFSVMGAGCESVQRTHSQDTDIVVGRWKDGRLGSFRGIRSGKTDYGAAAFGSKGIRVVERAGADGYTPMLREIVKFLQTGISPVPLAETMEIMAFMEAADLSKARGGQEVKLAEVMR